MYPSKSKLNLLFSNGFEKRFTFKFVLNDFLVLSIMKTFKRILPSYLYETLTQDLMDTLTRCNPAQKSESESQT